MLSLAVFHRSQLCQWVIFSVVWLVDLNNQLLLKYQIHIYRDQKCWVEIRKTFNHRRLQTNLYYVCVYAYLPKEEKKIFEKIFDMEYLQSQIMKKQLICYFSFEDIAKKLQ